MQTFRDLVYMVMDEVKLQSDDSYFTEDHIIFLLVKYRAFLLKQKYSDIKKYIPESNYQEIIIDMENIPSIPGIPEDNSYYLKSTSNIPLLLPIGIKRVFTDSYYKGEITYIYKDRMRYTGYNKYLKNISYCSVSSDECLYLKSKDSSILDISNLYLYGIFQDAAKASDFTKEKDKDVLDRNFPLEDSLVSPLIELTVKELLGAAYRPKDSINDASDDLSDLVSFIRRNAKSNLQKQIED